MYYESIDNEGLKQYAMTVEGMADTINHIQRLKVFEQWERIKNEIELLRGSLYGSLFKEEEYELLIERADAFEMEMGPLVDRFNKAD